MNKPLFLGIILGTTLLLSACGKSTTTIQTNIKQQSSQNAYINSGNNNNSSTTGTSSSGSIEKKPMDSMISLLKKGENVKCSFTLNILNGGSGLLYVDGKSKKLRSEITFISSDKQFIAYTIIKDQTIYSRNNVLPPKGVKAQLDNDFKLLSGDNAAAGNIDKELTLDCKPWESSEYEFQIPGTVSFTNMQEAMKLMKDQLPKTPKELCESCNLIKTDTQEGKDFKDECIKANCKK